MRGGGLKHINSYNGGGGISRLVGFTIEVGLITAKPVFERIGLGFYRIKLVWIKLGLVHI